MKKIILGLFSLMLSINIFAQSDIKVAAQSATDKLATLYQLSPDQTAEMLKIQERRYKHIQTIQSLRNSDPDLYIKKRKAVESGVDASTRRVLTDEQEIIMKEQWKQRRANRAALMKKMYSEGASSIDIQDAVLEIQ